jgi:hypothetical protein
MRRIPQIKTIAPPGTVQPDGSTDTKVRARVLRNFTRPSALAKIV